MASSSSGFHSPVHTPAPSESDLSDLPPPINIDFNIFNRLPDTSRPEDMTRWRESMNRLEDFVTMTRLSPSMEEFWQDIAPYVGDEANHNLRSLLKCYRQCWPARLRGPRQARPPTRYRGMLGVAPEAQRRFGMSKLMDSNAKDTQVVHKGSESFYKLWRRAFPKTRLYHHIGTNAKGLNDRMGQFDKDEFFNMFHTAQDRFEVESLWSRKNEPQDMSDWISAIQPHFGYVMSKRDFLMVMALEDGSEYPVDPDRHPKIVPRCVDEKFLDDDIRMSLFEEPEPDLSSAAAEDTDAEVQPQGIDAHTKEEHDEPELDLESATEVNTDTGIEPQEINIHAGVEDEDPEQDLESGTEASTIIVVEPDEIDHHAEAEHEGPDPEPDLERAAGEKANTPINPHGINFFAETENDAPEPSLTESAVVQTHAGAGPRGINFHAEVEQEDPEKSLPSVPKARADSPLEPPEIDIYDELDHGLRLESPSLASSKTLSVGSMDAHMGSGEDTDVQSEATLADEEADDVTDDVVSTVQIILSIGMNGGPTTYLGYQIGSGDPVYVNNSANTEDEGYAQDRLREDRPELRRTMSDFQIEPTDILYRYYHWEIEDVPEAPPPLRRTKTL
ncbi:hypothetical protein K402DRAFT_416701 [Aulographum hederae CBS 113979]|uniref:Uncharacterized protein n=1 Tax=Aulographum hederae CBS 113979 TaxID=1176131 RepID=A0A6G1HE88_9PEZI|nr:hypothetical protein K402DRAFT_416701 [Aulographum hederae CBS 113979]